LSGGCVVSQPSFLAAVVKRAPLRRDGGWCAGEPAVRTCAVISRRGGRAGLGYRVGGPVLRDLSMTMSQHGLMPRCVLRSKPMSRAGSFSLFRIFFIPFLPRCLFLLFPFCARLQPEQSITNGSGMFPARDFNSFASPRLVLHFESEGFLVFYNCRMHWCSSPRADPASDILSVEFHRGRALDALRAPDPVCYTLLDQRYFSGLGEF